MGYSRTADWALLNGADTNVARSTRQVRQPREGARPRLVLTWSAGLPMDGAAPPDSPTADVAAPNYLGYIPIYLGIGVVVVLVVKTADARMRRLREPSLGVPLLVSRSGGGTDPHSWQLRELGVTGPSPKLDPAMERPLCLCRPEHLAPTPAGRR